MRSSDFVITRMITDRIGLHPVLLPLLICYSLHKCDVLWLISVASRTVTADNTSLYVGKLKVNMEVSPSSFAASRIPEHLHWQSFVVNIDLGADNLHNCLPCVTYQIFKFSVNCREV